MLSRRESAGGDDHASALRASGESGHGDTGAWLPSSARCGVAHRSSGVSIMRRGAAGVGDIHTGAMRTGARDGVENASSSGAGDGVRAGTPATCLCPGDGGAASVAASPPRARGAAPPSAVVDS